MDEPKYTYIDLNDKLPDDILHITINNVPYGVTVKNLKKLLDTI